METKLNDNEVKEIAQMQTKINEYESFICTLSVMVKFKKTNLNYLQLRGTPLTKEMNSIWRFVKQEIKDNESKKDSKAAEAVP